MRLEGSRHMQSADKPIANPTVILRKEFDDWAVLFDPDSGRAFGLNPTGVFIWERLDGRHAVDDIVRSLAENTDGFPTDGKSEIDEFIRTLVEQGLAGYEIGR